MGRHEIVVEIEVSASPAKVYAVVSDSRRTLEWLPNVTDVALTSAAKGVGVTRTVKMRMGNTDLVSHQRIVAAEPGKRFAWIHDQDFVDDEHFDLLSDVGTVFDLIPKGSGTLLRATAHFQPKGLKARLAAPLFTHDVKKQMRSALENIKRLAET